MKQKTTSEQRHTSERGQSLILMAFVFVGFLILVGLAIDLGLVYIERVQLGRAVDAAVLGAVQELPNETAAFERVLMFLRDNGYDYLTEATIYWNGAWYNQSVPQGDAPAVIYINTANYRDAGEPDTAMRIEVRGTSSVPLHFMKFAGPWFNEVDVPGRAVAENVQDLDVVVVLDRSGSMEFDTICYGCWEVDDEEGYDYDEWATGDAYTKGDGTRGGAAHPLAYPHDLCTGSTHWTTQGSYDYIVIEAEHYTQNWPTFDPEYRTRKSTYWGLQRNAKRSTTVGDDPTRCDGVTGEKAGCGGYMQHNPWRYVDAKQVYTTADCPPSSAEGVPNCYTQAPQLVYHFRVPGADTYDVWLRAQGGSTTHFGVSPALVHWGIDGAYEGSSTGFRTGGDYQGAVSTNWRWVRVGDFTLGSGWNITHTLTLWGGGSGFRVDKIAITDAPDWAADDVLCAGDCSGNYESTGPDATIRRDGYACWACNPLYGQPAEGSYCEGVWDANPQWGAMYGAMFDDQQPIRAAKEAIKLFIEPPEDMDNRLEPKFDQIGFVSYSDNSSIDSELECVKRLGAAACEAQGYTPVLGMIELADSGGNTNTGSALWDAICVQMNGQEGIPGADNVFRIEGRQHYGRPGTSRFIILLTDGNPTANPSDIDCPDVWPGGGENYDCAVHFAEQAKDQGVILYTIGLGESVDESLLSHMANVANGAYFPAPNKEDLADIFLEILSRIYIRLIE